MEMNKNGEEEKQVVDGLKKKRERGVASLYIFLLEHTKWRKEQTHLLKSTGTTAAPNELQTLFIV
jgi:hypothetical protein